MKLIAHRGYHQNGIPENSLASFQKAIDLPEFVGFEFDIRTSKDGVFVVHHDLFEDGNLIRFMDYQELKEKYHLPRLEEVLSLKTDKIMMLEIKEFNLDIPAFLKIVNQYPKTNLYIFSFDNLVIQKIRNYPTHARLGVLNYIINSEESYDEYDFIGLLSPIVTEELISFFQKQKMEVFIYGITSKQQIGKFADVYYIVDEIKERE